jgi:hypothetical protein
MTVPSLSTLRDNLMSVFGDASSYQTVPVVRASCAV